MTNETNRTTAENETTGTTAANVITAANVTTSAKMTRLSRIFSDKLGISADFYLTEENFQSQRFLFAGMEQLRELAEMKKAGIFDFETVILTDETPADNEKTPASVSSVTDVNLQAAITGFVLVERRPSDDPACNDTGNCLVFTPAVSDAGAKRAFQSIISELTAPQFAGGATNGGATNGGATDGGATNGGTTANNATANDAPVHRICISEKELVDDVIEYYSKTALSFFQESGALLPSYDSVYSKSRVQKAAAVLQKVAGLPAVKESGRAFLAPEFRVLEICCGNGMSTLGLYEKGIVPLSVDINAEDVCIGLAHGVLKPEKTIVMDATALSKNLDAETFDTVIGFMIGTIYEFNKELWFSIAGEALKMLKQGGFLLLTLRAEHEAVWVADYLKSLGVAGEIIDNRDNETNYDEWIYFAGK